MELVEHGRVQPDPRPDKKRQPCRRAHFFVQSADADHVFFEYTPVETSKVVSELFRGSKRIYSAWPTMHQVGLPPGWRWSGRHYSLRPAQYRWYVWAGFGARRLARYRLVGSARFAVPRWEK